MKSAYVSSNRKPTLLLVFVMLVVMFLAACGGEQAATDMNEEGNVGENGNAVENDNEIEEGNDNVTEKNGDAAETNEEQDMETSISLGSTAQGSAYNSVASGVASVISDHSPVQVDVRPFTGPNAFLPLLDDNEVQLGISAGPDAGWAFTGEGYNEPNIGIRSILRGNWTNTVGFVVREDSDIQEAADLVGKNVASDYGAHRIIITILETQLEYAGLSWDDVSEVPVPGFPAGIEGIQEGRIDAAFGGTPTAAAGLEVDSAVGLRPLNYGDVPPEEIDQFPEDLMEMLEERIVGSRVTTLQGGYADEEVTLIEYPLFFLANEELSEDAVYEILDSLWENYEDLHPIFDWLEQWESDSFFDPTPPAPYHEGAVQFYKDKDVWTDEAEEYHQKLLEMIE